MKKTGSPDQVFYQGRWVGRDNFRAFVYGANCQKLANSYDEFEKLIGSGSWYSTKEEVVSSFPSVRKARKAKDGADS